MRFHQVSELIEWAGETHGRLSQQYKQLSTQCKDERVRMALMYLAEQEHAAKVALASYLDEEGDARLPALDSWFSDATQFPHLEVIENLCEEAAECSQLLDEATVESLLANTLAIHKTLEDMYRQRAKLARTNNEQALFETLTRGHNAGIRRIVRDMSRLDMY